MVKFPLKLFILLASYLFGFVSVLFAGDGSSSLCGRIVDTAGKPVFAANIYLKQHLRSATASDIDGRFCLQLPSDCQGDSLVVSFVGYRSYQQALAKLNNSKDELQIVLKEDWAALNAVVLVQNPEISEEFSLEKLEKMDIYLSPVAAGDPLNALTVLPAATNTGENANPEFRGSSANASQVVLNGINIANPVRNTQMNGMGNFSLFNTELLQSMTVFASNPPLSFGNSTAGMVDIKSTQQLEQSQTQLAVSMANVGFLRSQKLSDQAFAQVYANCQFSGPYLYLNDCQDMLQAFSSRDAGLNLHTKAGKMSFNYYTYFINEDYLGKEHVLQAAQTSKAWKRRHFGVFNWHGSFDRLQTELNLGHDWNEGERHLSKTQAWMEERDYQFNIKLKYFLNDALYCQIGYADEYRKIDYRSSEPLHYWDISDKAVLRQQDSCLHYRLPEVFAYARWKQDRLSGGLGLRHQITGPWAAQAHLRYHINQEHSLQASAGNYYAQQASLQALPRIHQQLSRQAALEYDYRSESTHLSAAVYHKQEEGAYYFSWLEQWQDCNWKTNGLELSIEQQWNSLRLAASYTGMLGEICWNGKSYAAPNSLPYTLKSQLSYTNSQMFSISLSANFRSGLRYTPITGAVWREEQQCYEPVYGELFNARLKPYQRVDLSFNKVYNLGGNCMMVAFACLSNIFNHLNPAGWVYSWDYAEKVASIPMQRYSIYGGIQLSF